MITKHTTAIIALPRLRRLGLLSLCCSVVLSYGRDSNFRSAIALGLLDVRCASQVASIIIELKSNKRQWKWVRAARMEATQTLEYRKRKVHVLWPRWPGNDSHMHGNGRCGVRDRYIQRCRAVQGGTGRTHVAGWKGSVPLDHQLHAVAIMSVLTDCGWDRPS